MRATITEMTVRSLKPAARQYRLWDMKTPGFGILVGKSKSWICMYGPRRKLKAIGKWPDMSLADARTAAKTLMLEKSGRLASKRFGDALDRYYDLHLPTLRHSSAYNLKGLMERHWRTYATRDLDDLTPQDIVLYLDTLTKTPTERHKAFKELRAFYRWCMGRQYTDENPCARLKAPPQPKSRARVLTDAEISKVWNAAENMGGHFSKIVRLLILTGARRGEIAKLRGEYIDRQHRLITLPGEAVKNGRTHTIPYGPLVEGLLPSVHIGWLFPAKGRPLNAFNGFAAPKLQLDKASGVDFDLHDLRRTMATRWAEFGISPHIIERALNHIRGEISPVAQIYNRHTYAKEVAAAYQKWEAHLREVCGVDEPHRDATLHTPASVAG